MNTQQILQPQELEVFYIIPTIRRYLTVYMKELGKPQKEIAKILGVQESTISQYVRHKRAAEINLSQEIESKIKEAVSRINNSFDVIRETQQVLKVIRDSGEMCKIHKQLADIPENCDIKIMGCNF